MRTISKVLGETQVLKFQANKPMNITLKISQFGLKHFAKVPRKIKGLSRLLLDITNYYGKGCIISVVLIYYLLLPFLWLVSCSYIRD